MVGVEGDSEPLPKPYYRYADEDIAEIFSRRTGADFYTAFQHGSVVADAVMAEPDLSSRVLHHTLAAFNAGKNGNKAPNTSRSRETAVELGKLLGEDGRAIADHYFTEAYESGREHRNTPSPSAKNT